MIPVHPFPETAHQNIHHVSLRIDENSPETLQEV
jgi:hypothetical protein